jgi:hypothetical protein
VCGFTVSPTEVLIAIFHIAFALVLAIAHSRTANQATIGDIIADIGKSVNITSL